MSDLVTRLRDLTDHGEIGLRSSAADEIERLQSRLDSATKEIEFLRPKYDEAAELVRRVRDERFGLLTTVGELQQMLVDRETTIKEQGCRLDPCIEALEHAELALNDWVATYADDISDPNTVARANSRIMKRGGTLAYIAEALGVVRAAINGTNSSPAACSHVWEQTSADTGYCKLCGVPWEIVVERRAPISLPLDGYAERYVDICPEPDCVLLRGHGGDHDLKGCE